MLVRSYATQLRQGSTPGASTRFVACFSVTVCDALAGAVTQGRADAAMPQPCVWTRVAGGARAAPVRSDAFGESRRRTARVAHRRANARLRSLLGSRRRARLRGAGASDAPLTKPRRGQQAHRRAVDAVLRRGEVFAGEGGGRHGRTCPGSPTRRERYVPHAARPKMTSRWKVRYSAPGRSKSFRRRSIL